MNDQDTLISSHVIDTRLPKRAHLYKAGKAIALAAGLCVVMLTASAANAATIQLRAWLNGAQVPLAVGGTGIGTASFDTITKLLSWSVTYTGLSGACTNAHFHGPAAAGVNNSPTVSMTCSASPLTGTSAALNPTQEAQLLLGQWYINIHTAANSGGEICGQVLPVRGDTNGDGKADILWRNSTTGENYIYFMDGVTIASEGYIRTVPLAWSVAGVGDFNSDGKADILWRNSTTGEDYIYFMDGVAIASEGYIRTVPLAWSVAGFAGDHGGSSGPSLQLGFHYSGNFFGGTAGQINYPAPVYYIANFQTNDTVTPASVFFTGPSGSGLSNTESVAKFSNNPGPGAGFASPQKTEVPSGGAWSVNYNGQPVNFTLPNPDSTNRGIIIVPTITVSGDTVTAINWQYKNSAGTTVTPPQSFVANVEFGIDGLVNSQTVRLYDQYNIPFETTAHTLGTPVTWSAVTHLAMTVRDNQNNYFTSHWYATNPPAPTITSLNPTSAPVGNTITITGTNFGCTGCVGGVNAVRFTGPGGSGSSGVSALFTINSSTQITATVPAGVQTGTVWMQALGQTTNSAQTFTAQ